MTKYHHDFAAIADEILAYEVGHKIAPYMAAALGQGFQIPASAPNITAAAKMHLVSQRHLFDCGHVGRSAASLAATLTKRTGGKGRVARRMRDILDLGCPHELAVDLAEIGNTDRAFLLLAMEGRLASASIAIPTAGIGELSVEEVLDVLELLARYHLLANLIRAGEDGFQRVFETTGHDGLDYNNGKITSEASAARYLTTEASRVLSVLDLYKTAQHRELTGDERRQLEAHPELAIARREEGRILDVLGEEYAHIYIDLLATRAQPWTRHIKLHAGQFARKRDAYRRPLHRLHGPDALTILWLAVTQAVAWASCARDPVAPFRRALEAARQSRPILQPTFHEQDVGDIRSLFFLLRNYFVCDPRSPAARKFNKGTGKSYDEFTDMLWELEAGKPAGAEPFSHAASTSASVLLAEMKDDPDRPEYVRIRGEMAGSILIQLSV